MQGERHGKNAFTVGGEERPARRRSFLSDTMQFMPQASTGINAEGAVTLLLASDAAFCPSKEGCEGQDVKECALFCMSSAANIGPAVHQLFMRLKLCLEGAAPD